MKNKQHKYILKAFLESKIPARIRLNAPELIAIDSIIGGCCTQLLKQSKFIEFPADINQSAGMEKDELVIYYRLAILAESILIQYRQ